MQNSLFQCSTGKRDIQALRVKCSNVTRTCEWEGTVGTLEAHVDTCEFTLVPCPKECKAAIKYVMRKHLDNHLEKDCPNRDHQCEYCGKKGTYAHITQVHDNTCDKKIVQCPNTDCTKTIQRRNAKRHLEECDFSEIPCKYQRLGCGVKMMRKNIPSHEDDDKLHLHMALDKVVSMEEEIATIKNCVKEDKIKTLTFEFSDFQKIKADNARFCSQKFFSSLNGYNMQVAVDANGVGDGEDTHVSVFVNILEGKHDAKLKWPFAGNVTVDLLNQLKDNNHYQRVVHFGQEHNILVGSGRGYSKFVPHFKLARHPVKNQQYLKDDTLYFRVSVDIPDHKPWLECTAK